MGSLPYADISEETPHSEIIKQLSIPEILSLFYLNTEKHDVASYILSGHLKSLIDERELHQSMYKMQRIGLVEIIKENEIPMAKPLYHILCRGIYVARAIKKLEQENDYPVQREYAVKKYYEMFRDKYSIKDIKEIVDEFLTDPRNNINT